MIEKIAPTFNNAYIEVIETKTSIGGMNVPRKRDDGYTEAKIVALGECEEEFNFKIGQTVLLQLNASKKHYIINVENILAIIE